MSDITGYPFPSQFVRLLYSWKIHLFFDECLYCFSHFLRNTRPSGKSCYTFFFSSVSDLHLWSSQLISRKDGYKHSVCMRCIELTVPPWHSVSICSTSSLAPLLTTLLLLVSISPSPTPNWHSTDASIDQTPKSRMSTKRVCTCSCLREEELEQVNQLFFCRII